jgi:hypothetical protein
MALATYPPAGGGGGIKSVQRGLASASGTVTITSVDTAKSFVNVFGTTSSGSAAISGNINAANGSESGHNLSKGASNLSMTWSSQSTGLFINDAGYTTTVNTGWTLNGSALNANGSNIGLNAVNMSAGTTNLVTAVTQGYLSNSTSLVVSGACRWEVVEFN